MFLVSYLNNTQETLFEILSLIEIDDVFTKTLTVIDDPPGKSSYMEVRLEGTTPFDPNGWIASLSESKPIKSKSIFPSWGVAPFRAEK